MQRKCVFPCSDFKARPHRARSSCVAAKEPAESPSPSSTHSSSGSIRDTSHLFPKMTCPLSPINYLVIIKLPEQEQLSEVRFSQNCMQSFTASQFGTNSHQGQTERKATSSKPRSHQDTKPASSQCLPTRVCLLPLFLALVPVG